LLALAAGMAVPEYRNLRHMAGQRPSHRVCYGADALSLALSQCIIDVVAAPGMGAAYFEKYQRLMGLAPDRIAKFARIVEDMKRRSVWTFVRTDYVHHPADYRLRVLM